MKFLVVVDMQNDFIDGSLGTPEAEAIVPDVLDKIKNFDGTVLATQDTHGEDYLNTQEGRRLPVPHCVRGTKGWELQEDLAPLLKERLEKPTFGSLELPRRIQSMAKTSPVDEIELIGICTDICVISNAMILKAAFPEATVKVDSSCCAGVTPESHANALDAMKACQIEVK